MSGQGAPRYPVIVDYIASCDNVSEVYSMFGRRANRMYGQLLGSSKRGSEYYAEILRLCQNISALTESSYGKVAKGSALSDICAMLYGGGISRIRAALDLRVTRYVAKFMQYPDEEIRKKCALLLYQLSRAIANDDIMELLGNPLNAAKAVKPEKSLKEINKDLSLIGYINNQNSASDILDSKRYIAFAYDLPAVHFQHNRLFMAELAGAFLNPMLASSLIRQVKLPTESASTKSVILKTLVHVFASTSAHMLHFESVLADVYSTLGKLMISLSGKEKKLDSSLLVEVKEFFTSIFGIRNPRILEKLKHSYGIKGILKKGGLVIPKLRTLTDIFEVTNKLLAQPEITKETVASITQCANDFKAILMYNIGKNTEMTVTMRRDSQHVVNILFKLADRLWNTLENSKEANKIYVINVIRNILEVWDWLCSNKNLHGLVIDIDAEDVIGWILGKLTIALSEFRKEKGAANYLSDTLYDKRKIKKAEQAHKYSIMKLLPLTIPLQRIIVVFVKLNYPELNEVLERNNFGHVFGEHLQLQYDFLKLAMDFETERLGLLDVYVEQNENRLFTLEYLLKSKSSILKTQFLKSRFVERLAAEYIKDSREFSVRFNKIDLKFLAYRQSYPIRNEAISIMSELLKSKETAYELYAELIQRLSRHQVITHEVEIVKNYANVPELKLQTALVFFSVILQAGDDIDRTLKDEGVTDIINTILKAKPRLKNEFPMLGKYFSLR